MQAKVGHGEEEEGGMGDDGNAGLRAGHEPLHEAQPPSLDLLLLLPEIWPPQLILLTLNLYQKGMACFGFYRAATKHIYTKETNLMQHTSMTQESTCCGARCWEFTSLEAMKALCCSDWQIVQVRAAANFAV